tara:strand:- start:4170 stop:4433 length:264 start_codon:yes stop_codon:yes gene_type:complete
MTEIELTIKALEEGILPAFSGNEIEKLLETCDPDQARKMKRKFRKLWRKELKKRMKGLSPLKQQEVRDDFKHPAARRRIVRQNLMSD